MGKIQHDIDLSKHLIKNGPKFCSHRVNLSTDKQSALIKPTMATMSFCYFYLTVGILFLVAAAVIYSKGGQLDFTLFMVALGVAIGTFGATLIKPMLRPAKFDKNTKDFSNHNERIVELVNIRSLQLNDKRVMAGGGTNYLCYELNMLTANGRRINLLNHNDLDTMRKDTQLISQFLGIESQEYLTES